MAKPCVEFVRNTRIWKTSGPNAGSLFSAKPMEDFGEDWDQKGVTWQAPCLELSCLEGVSGVMSPCLSCVVKSMYDFGVVYINDIFDSNFVGTPNLAVISLEWVRRPPASIGTPIASTQPSALHPLAQHNML